MRKILALGLSAALAAPALSWSQPEAAAPSATPPDAAPAAPADEETQTRQGAGLPAAEGGPTLGDPAPAPAPAPQATAGKDKKPGMAKSLGGAVGGALGTAAGAAGGPIGSAVAGAVGNKAGQGAVGFFKRLFGRRKAKRETMAAAAQP